MKINKKSNTNTDITNDIQNNQWKKILSNINKLGLRRVLLVNIVHKRNMFTKGGNIVGKKSGELMISGKKETILPTPYNTSIRLNALNLPIKNTNTLLSNQQIYKFSSFNKFDLSKTKYIYVPDCKYYRFNLHEMVPFLKKCNFNLHKCGEITDLHMLNYNLCLTSLMRGVKTHTVIIDIKEQTSTYVTYRFAVVSTSQKGVRITKDLYEKKVLVYNDLKTDKEYHTIKVFYEDKVPIEDYTAIVGFLKQEDNWDSPEVQKGVVEGLQRIQDESIKLNKPFKVFDMRYFLETPIKDIDFTKVIKIDKSTVLITDYTGYLLELLKI